jgi:Domain of unknown function (DUF4168)
MKRIVVVFAVFIALVGLGLSFVPAAVAAGDGSSAPAYGGAMPSAPNGAINDATLKKAAAAFVQVKNISAHTQEQLQNVKDDSQRREILARAESQKITAVKNEGMEPAQYNSVIRAVQNDESLRGKFTSYVSQANGASGQENAPRGEQE